MNDTVKMDDGGILAATKAVTRQICHIVIHFAMINQQMLLPLVQTVSAPKSYHSGIIDKLFMGTN